MHYVFRCLTYAALALLASSCRDVTNVQTGYISDRDSCHSRADYAVGSYGNAGGVSAKERNNMRLQMFCECMKEQDWSVAGCKYAGKDVARATAPTQPTVVVVQAPPAAAAVAAPPPAVAECPAPPKAKNKKKRVKRKPDGTCPAPEDYSQWELDNVLSKP